ncbi:MAG: quinohemoprotein ethanol dehydrogenase [Rhizorhabdus sp.]|nr:quinohemoprotein ethanol dehydrogenase [Rhizorhabdus sp.]
MPHIRRLLIAAALAGLALPSLASIEDATARILSNTQDGADWAAYGRTYDESHYSPLDQISAASIGKLGLAWSIDLPPSVSAVGAPLAVDGILYVPTGLSVVRAIDPTDGRVLWTYDPDVAAVAGETLRPAWGIRGMAYGYGKLFIGTQDGRLIALDATTGKPDWSVQTTTPGDGRYITGAPRVFDGKVIIGHGGADFKPVRGYVTTYDARSGKLLWRFHIVPGDPALGFENDAMRAAAKTWKGKWWKHGGGGAAWNAFTYDPQYHRIYIGTGNGAPWNQDIRSPGGGDNLFLSSILALDADTGAYAWHYQTTPGDNWDYNAAMDMILADLPVRGKPTPVLMQAPKNGFFYVIDRSTGKLVSADPFVPVTWASKVDPQTGRPIENPGARFPSSGGVVSPSSGGGHSWQPMAFSPKTRLVYIPSTDLPEYFDKTGIDPKSWKPAPGMVRNSGYNLITHMGGGALERPPGLLQAWSPLGRKAVWSVPLPAPVNGGVMATGGGLVFQGQADGRLHVYDAARGKPLWTFDAHVGILGQPITYLARGRQYVTIVAGFGGGGAGYGQLVSGLGWQYREQHRRILTFAIGGKAKLPDGERGKAAIPIAYPGFVADPAQAETGARLYAQSCQYCHGQGVASGGSAPDLRASDVIASPEIFEQIVGAGALVQAGMPRFAELSPADLAALRHYIMAQSQHDARPARR